MAERIWLGRAAATRQVSTLTVTAPVVIGETWTVTINGKNKTYTAAAGTTADVVAGVLALLTDANVEAEFKEADWAAADPVITMTATQDFAGVPITVATSTDSAGGTFVTATTTAADGPGFVSNVNNWSGGALPVNGDNVRFEPAPTGPKHALSQLAAVAPASIDVDLDQAGYQIGLPRISTGGYTEYRNRFLEFNGATIVRYHGSRVDLCNLDFNAGQAAIEVFTTGSATQEPAALNIIGTHADNSLEVTDGQVGIAAAADEVATFKTIKQAGGDIRCGIGATLNGAGSTLDLLAGSFTCETALLTVTAKGGIGTINGSGAITTLAVFSGATWNQNSSGTVTAATVGGTLVTDNDASQKTCTDLTLDVGGNVTDHRVLTVTNGTGVTSEVKTLSAA